jgi:hypothetical protein
MEIPNTPITQEQERDQWTSLLSLIPQNTESGKNLRKAVNVRRQRENTSHTYKQRRILSEQLTETKRDMPQRILGLMNDLAVALDDEDTDALQEKMFDPENKNSLMECVADLLFIANHTEVIKPKKDYSSTNRLTRAQILARASDPNDMMYGFCPKCNRPMAKNMISHHQKNTSICVEIKAGKEKALELGRVKHSSIGQYIAQRVYEDPNDSDDEE